MANLLSTGRREEHTGRLAATLHPQGTQEKVLPSLVGSKNGPQTLAQCPCPCPFWGRK